MNGVRIRMFIPAVVVAMVAVPRSPAATGLVTVIEHPDAEHTRPVGINARGTITGNYVSALDGLTYTFVLDRGEFRPAVLPGTGFVNVGKINASGDTVGIFQPPNSTTLRGYLAQNGEIYPVDVPNARGTTPAGINERGDIVGSYRDQAGATHAFVFSDGVFTSFDFPGGTLTAALDINARGDIVGRYQRGPNFQMFLFSQGEFTRIEVPGAISTGAAQNGAGINARGEIVGQFVGSDGRIRGFVRDQHGDYTAIDIDGAIETRPIAIDESGNVLGRFRRPSMRESGFLLQR